MGPCEKTMSGPDRTLLPVTGEEVVRRALNVVAVVAIVDALLLVPLEIAALKHAEGTIDILGPMHGVGFLILVGLVYAGRCAATGAGGSRR